MVVCLSMLAVSTSDLHIVLVCNGLELVLLSAKLWQMYVDRGSESSAQVCWARCDIARLLRVGKFGNLLDLIGSSGKSCKDCTNICTRLHRDNSELVLFVDPNKESLIVVVEDASSCWPVSVEATSLEESVAFFEEEVVLDELLLFLWSHGAERIVLSCKFTLELAACFNNLLLDLVPLIFGYSRSKREVCKVATYSDPGAADHLGIFWVEGWTLKMGSIHVALMASA